MEKVNDFLELPVVLRLFYDTPSIRTKVNCFWELLIFLCLRALFRAREMCRP